MAVMIRMLGKSRWLRRATALMAGLAAAAILAHDRVTAQDAGVATPDTGVATLLTIQGPIGPAVADYVKRGITKSVDRGASVIVLQMDTPGGLDTSMREIIQDVLASPVPVVGYVGPSGARAASAGTYMLYAAHVAAMAPGTNLGAATPVQLGGGAPKPEEPADKDKETARDGDDPKNKDAADKAKDEPAEATDSAPHGKPGMEEKVLNDAVAYIRSLAQLRGRNIDWAEKAITEAASLSAEDALAENVIDLIATDVTDLLEKVDGREVQAGTASWTLETAGIAVEAIERDWRTEFLEIITNPTIAYMLLFTIGIPALLLEFYTGTLAAGVVGAICILLGLYGLHLLPLDYAGLALILLGLALITAEAFVPSVGVLGLGGVASFVVGSVMLIDTDVPGYGISPLAIGAMAVVGGGFMLLAVVMLIHSRERPAVSGAEAMAGGRGLVLDWSNGAGHVRFQGEVWQARSDMDVLEDGTEIEVVDRDGLILNVRPFAASAASEDDSN